MAGIPQNFQSLSPVLANYDFVDIASGTGYIVFYAGNTADDYLLTTFSYYANDVAETATKTDDTNYTKMLDVDFDVVLNRPLDVRGIAIINVPVGGNKSAGLNYGNAYIVAKISKWDGSTETVLATAANSDTFSGGNQAYTYEMVAVSVSVPLTHFKIGETLRLTIELWGKTGASTSTMIYALGEDPKNRSDGWDTTGAVPSQLSFQCPVRLNL